MRYLIDTHILLWMLTSPNKLGRKQAKILRDDDAELFVSHASLWEMSIKISLKKLQIPTTIEALVDTHVLGNGIHLLTLKKEHIYTLTKLPFHHRDPFDRLLISQAKHEELVLLTADKAFKHYDIKCIY